MISIQELEIKIKFENTFIALHVVVCKKKIIYFLIFLKCYKYLNF